LDYLNQTLESFHSNLDFGDLEITKILIDDYPLGRNDNDFYEIKERYSFDQVILNEENLGQSASWKKAWGLLDPDTDFIWHQEDDFIFPNSVDVARMARLMEMLRSQALQVSLKRQQWYADDNDFIHKINSGMSGEEFHVENKMCKPWVDDWVIFHQEYFNANPCIYPYWVTQEAYRHNPQESVIMDYFRQNCGKRFSSCVLGRREDPPACIHIGEYNQGRKVLEGEPGWDWLKLYDPEKKYCSKSYLKEYE